ncbi:hypothetical protein ACTFIR_005182 [Dictyostelium discoideum]
MKDYISSPLSPSNKKMPDNQKISPTNTPIRKKLFENTQSPIHFISNNNNTTTPAKGLASVIKFNSSNYGNHHHHQHHHNNNSTVSGSAIKQHLNKSTFSTSGTTLTSSSDAILLPEDKVPMSVYLRIRPLSKKEIESKESNCFTVLNTTSVSIKSSRSDSDSNKFSFSSVLPPNTTQPQLFKTITHPLIQSFLNGHNVLLLAYGVTNAGKTYTVSGSKRNPGIIPRSLDLIFKSIPNNCLKKTENLTLSNNNNNNNSKDSKDILADSSDDEYTKVDNIDSSDEDDSNAKINSNLLESFSTTNTTATTNVAAAASSSTTTIAAAATSNGDVIQISDQFNYSIWISYYEIYKKNIYDLLDDSPSSKKKQSLKIESDNSVVNIKGLKEILVSSVEDARDIVEQGESNRKVGGTKLNATSSRSHAVLTIKLFTSPRHIPKSDIHPSQIRCSKLCIIDLAGSERASRTETTGETFKEGSSINTSLFTLGKCIEGLKQQALQQQQQHSSKRQSIHHSNPIPWRESDLTRICQEYFCGNGKASMIVNVSPSSCDSEETLNVLRFSASAKEITTLSKIKPMVFLPPPPTTPSISSLKKRKSMEQPINNNNNNSNSNNNNNNNNAYYNITQLQNSVNEIKKKIHLDNLLAVGQLPISNNNNNNSNGKFDYISMEKDQLLDQIQIYQKKLSNYEIKFVESEVTLREEFNNELIKNYIELENQYKERLVKESQLIHDRVQSKLSLIKNVNINQTNKLNCKIEKLELQLQQQQQKTMEANNNNKALAIVPQTNKRTDDEWIIEITEVQTERDNIQNKLNSILFELDEQRQHNQFSLERIQQFTLQTEQLEIERENLLTEIESMQSKGQELIKLRELEMMQLKESMNSDAQKDRENLEIQHNFETSNLNNQLQMERQEKLQIIEEMRMLKLELQQFKSNQSIEQQRNNNLIKNQYYNHNHPTAMTTATTTTPPILSTPIKISSVGKFKATPSKSLIKNILGAHSNSPFKNANIESSVGGGFKVQLNIPGSPIQLAPGTPNSIQSQTPDRPILDPNQYSDSGLLMQEIDDDDYLNITGGGSGNDGNWTDINVNDDSASEYDDLNSSSKSFTKKPKKTKSFGTIKRIKAVAMIPANIASSALNSSTTNIDEKEKLEKLEKLEKEKERLEKEKEKERLEKEKEKERLEKERERLEKEKEKERERLEREKEKESKPKVVKKTTSSSSIISKKPSSKTTSSLTNNNNNNKSISPIKTVQSPNSPSPTKLQPHSSPNTNAKEYFNLMNPQVIIHFREPETNFVPSVTANTTTTTSTSTSTSKSSKKTLDSLKDTPKKIANIFSSKSSKEKEASTSSKSSSKISSSTSTTSTAPKLKRFAAITASHSIENGSESSPIEVDTPPRITKKPPVPIVSKVSSKKVSSSSSSTSSSTSSSSSSATIKRVRKIVNEKKNYLEDDDDDEVITKMATETPRKTLGLRPRNLISQPIQFR